MEILVANFFNVEKTAADTDVSFTDILYTIDDRCADGSCDTIVVCFPHASDGCDIRLDKVMLRQICLSHISWVIPDTPFSVMTRSGLNSRILSHSALTCSSSICRILFQSVSLLISIL